MRPNAWWRIYRKLRMRFPLVAGAMRLSRLRDVTPTMHTPPARAVACAPEVRHSQ